MRNASRECERKGENTTQRERKRDGERGRERKREKERGKKGRIYIYREREERSVMEREDAFLFLGTRQGMWRRPLPFPHKVRRG